MRPTITAVGPLVEQIASAFDLTSTQLGLLGSLPLLMFALISPITPLLSARMGPDRVILLVLLAIASGILIRSFGGLAGLWFGAALATAAIAVANVLVPVIIKRDYANNIALATGIYSASMGAAAALASALAVPLAGKIAWNGSLAVWAIPAIFVALLWLPRVRQSTPQTPLATGRINVWRDRYAWWLTLYMGLQSATFYFMVTWLPAIEQSSGATEEEAGMTLFWYQIAGITAGLFIPMLMKNRSNQVGAALLASVPVVISFAGFLFLPQYGAFFAVLMGCGSGMSLVVSLSLIALRSSNGAETAKLSGMVQSSSYLLAALAPAVAGFLFENFASWKPALVMMLFFTLLQTGTAFIVGRSDYSQRHQ